MVEDLSVFFSDDGLKGVLSDDTEIDVLFDKAADPLDFDSEGLRITALIKSNDAVGINRGDAITIDGKTYTISQLLPDQDGKFTNLILSE